MLGDVYARYDPSKAVVNSSMTTSSIMFPNDFADTHSRSGLEDNDVMRNNIGARNVPQHICKILRRRQEWRDLTDDTQHHCLKDALKALVKLQVPR